MVGYNHPVLSPVLGNDFVLIMALLCCTVKNMVGDCLASGTVWTKSRSRKLGGRKAPFLTVSDPDHKRQSHYLVQLKTW